MIPEGMTAADIGLFDGKSEGVHSHVEVPFVMTVRAGSSKK